jgi:hypothetical protein
MGNGGGGIPGVLSTTLPTPRYILTPRGPKRAADAYRPGWERPGRPSWAGRDGRRCARGVPGGPVFDRNFRQKFSTYPIFDIPGFSTYPNSPVGGGPKSSTPLRGPPRALCPRAISDRGRPSYACQRARGGCAHDAVADVADGLGGWSREIGRILTKSLKWRFRSPKLAHFVWEKCRARTTYIVKGCPRKTFWTL